MVTSAQIIRTCEPMLCCDEIWEDAYLRFETSEEETRKFIKRLRRLGATDWPKDAQIVEIFCGRGNGLRALESLGFGSVEGVDLSERLLLQFSGQAKLYVADCRKLPFDDSSRDIVIVQGGLHHLPVLPDDLEAVVNDVHRVLRPGGRFVIVEPWMTPYLQFVHRLSKVRFIRRTFRKIDAFATMVEREEPTYFAWLALPQPVLQALAGAFVTDWSRTSFGKLEYVGVRQ